MDVNECRLELCSALGASCSVYFKTMKAWFKSKISKEEFDKKAFELLSNEMKLHNDFILSIITKCQIRHVPPPVFSNKPARKRFRKSNPSFHNRVPPTDIDNVEEGSVVYPSNLLPDISKECGVLPDMGAIHANCLLYCWQNELIDVDSQVTHIVWISVRTLILNILQSCIELRRAYCTNSNGMNHSFGTTKLCTTYPRGVPRPTSQVRVQDVLAVLEQVKRVVYL